MQHHIVDSTTGATLYWNGFAPHQVVGANWIPTAEISPWESAQSEVSADEIIRLFSRMDWLERRVETLMKRIEELGLTDVSDLI